jgi:hypothetical protein
MSFLTTFSRAAKGATCAIALSFVAVSSAGAQTVVVDDSFGDGITDSGALTAAGTAQIGFNVTSSGAALDLAQAPGPLDFASGNSGRTIHGLFPAQTLAAFGDALTLTFDFTTPTSIANDNGAPSNNEDFKFGLFDTSGTAGAIDVNTMLPIDFTGPVNTSSGTPNTALNGLAGFFGEIDNINAPGTDLGIRTNNVNNISGPAASQTGQFLQSNTGFDFIAGGDDDIISLAPDTDYTGTLGIEYTDASLTSFEITVAMADATGATIDTFTRTVLIADVPADFTLDPPFSGSVGVNTTTFDMFALHATTGAFGGTDGPAMGSSAVGEANNGIDISNVTITFVDSTDAGVLKGDVNLDGSVTFLDISPFIMLLSSNAFQAEADCDCDGDLDFLDIQPFIDILAGN